MKMKQIKVGIIMGSASDLPVMKDAKEILDVFGIEAEVQIVSAHRTPDKMVEYARSAAKRGIQVIIAGAGRCCASPRNDGIHDHASCHRSTYKIIKFY